MNIEIQKTDRDPQPRFSPPTEKYLEFITNALTSEKVSSLTPEIVAVGKEELEKGARPIHTLVMFFEIAKKSNDETKAAQKELEKHIKNQAKSQAPSQVITPNITMPAAAQEAPTVEAKQNAPEIQPSIPVEVGDTFKSDTTEYTVRGFAPGGGIQFKNTQGGKGVWSVARFNEYINDGRLVKQETVAAPETLAAPLERKTTNLPEVTLSLPMGDFVMKKGTQILKQDNEALHKLITSKVKKDLEGEVEKYEIKGTFKNEKNVVLVDIIPTYIGGAVGKPITRGQEWLESVPKPRQKSKENLEANQVVLDGATFNIGDALSQNIVRLINKKQRIKKAPRFDAWKLNRIFYMPQNSIKNDGAGNTYGGMHIEVIAQDDTKVIMNLTVLRNRLAEKAAQTTEADKNNIASITTSESAVETPASVEKIIQRPLTQQERQAVHAAFFARYPFLKPHVPEAPQMVTASEEMPVTNTLENPDAAAESALATQEESVPELVVENTQTAPAEETALKNPDTKLTHLVPAVKKSLEQFIDLDSIKIKGFSGDFFDKNIHSHVTEEETPELYQIIHKAMLGKNIIPVLGGSMYTVQKMYKENQPDGTFTRFVEIANQRGDVRAFSEEELSAIAQQNNLDTKTIQKENQTASLLENNSSDPSTPSDPLEVFDQVTRETATSESEPSLERTPLKKFTTSDLQGTVKNIFSTFNKVNEDMPISDIKVTSSEQGGMTVSLTQKIDNGILSRTSVLNASLDLVIQDGKLIPNNIRIESKDKKVSRNIEEYQNHIVSALTNLHTTLLLGNNLPIETTELVLENNNLVAYEK